MKSMKKLTCTACAFLLTFSLIAQEKSAEEDYLSTVEDVVITELANSDERDNKLVALQYLENAVEEGRVSPDMMVALDHLAGEGINTQSRQSGRLVNNYPDIRAKACDLLAKVPSEESKTTLKNIALADNEPMVITAAVRSLGEIGMNDNDDVVNTIAWANKKNAVLNVFLHYKFISVLILENADITVNMFNFPFKSHKFSCSFTTEFQQRHK